jgi:hypothetical protein
MFFTQVGIAIDGMMFLKPPSGVYDVRPVIVPLPLGPCPAWSAVVGADADQPVRLCRIRSILPRAQARW